MKKFTLVVKNILFLILITKISACNFSPGSYPYAEEYELDYPEDEVKNVINNFKQESTEYNVPKVTINGI